MTVSEQAEAIAKHDHFKGVASQMQGMVEVLNTRRETISSFLELGFHSNKDGEQK